MTRRSFMAFVGGVIALPSSLWATGSFTPPRWQKLQQVVRGYTCDTRYRIDRRKIPWIRGGQASIDWFTIQKENSSVVEGTSLEFGGDGALQWVGEYDFPILAFDGYKVFFQ